MPTPGVSVHAAPVRVDSVQVELVADRQAVTAGESLHLGLRIVHDQGWHTYWRNPGDSGLPTQFPLEVPEGFSAGEIVWPRPERFLIPPLANIGYDEAVLLVREVTVPGQVSTSQLTFSTLAQWLVCREVCIPGEARLDLTLPVTASPAPASAWAGEFRAALEPVPEVDTAVALEPGKLLLSVSDATIGERSSPPRIEYFPFEGGLVQHAAPQTLSRLDAQRAWVLEVPLDQGFPGQTPPAPSGQRQPGSPAGPRADGLIVVDRTKSLRVAARMVASDSFAGRGEPLATAQGEEVAIFSQRQRAGSGLLAALRDGLAGGAGGSQAGAGGNGIAAGTPAVSASAPAGFDAAAAARAPAIPGDWGGISPSLGLALVSALIGGLILNLMPCVFPVIGLKILGFAGAGGTAAGVMDPVTRRSVRSGSFWFSTGVVVSFLVLAGILLALRAAGQSVGWGFQLQSPLFVVLMALLFVAIGLNLSGAFEMGTALTRLGTLEQRLIAGPGPGRRATAAAGEGGGPGNAASRSPAHGGPDHRAARPWRAFGSGVLAVLVATPCTAPFMGSALGFTLAQPAGDTLAVFAALGTGMALPYLLLGLAPGALAWLPRPGPWMRTLREFLAFPMYAAAIWLAWVLGRQAGPDAMLALAMAAVLLALGLWIWGRLVQSNPHRSRYGWGMVSAGALIAAVALAWPSDAPAPARTESARAGWVDWEPGAVERELADGNAVFLDFTAAWCISCQVNKRLVLETDVVQRAFRDARVVAMQADWTRHDPAITAELARHGRNSVPLYLLYRPGAAAPVQLPELLTESIVLQALR